MKIGDYVRTDTGIIEKIEKIYKQNETNDTHIQLNRMGTGKSVFILDKNETLLNSKGEVIKSSPNIIDLIEVGDYVNGEQIIDIRSDDNINNEKLLYYYIPSDYGEDCFREQDIKSIVTKEQFESMEYKINE